MKTTIIATPLAVLLCTLCCNRAIAQADTDLQLQSLTQRVNHLEAKETQLLEIAQREASGAVIFLFGAFCALWAQNTYRNAWLWFFLGIFLNVFTVLALLYKNSKDRSTIFSRS